VALVGIHQPGSNAGVGDPQAVAVIEPTRVPGPVAALSNASILDSEKGFYAMLCLLSLLGAVAVQKKGRGLVLFEPLGPASEPGQGEA
jgi:hypothetical protein